MKKPQEVKTGLPRISIFDKKGQNKFNPIKINVGHNQTKGGVPQFRISQHKGA